MHVESRIGKKEKERTLKNHSIKGEASWDIKDKKNLPKKEISVR